MMISTSMPKSSGEPSTSMTLPTAFSPSSPKLEDLDVDDHAVEVFDGLDLGRFDADAIDGPAAIRESPCLRRSRSIAGCDRREASRSSHCRFTRNSPTTVACARRRMRRLRRRTCRRIQSRRMRAITRSPCMALAGILRRDEQVASHVLRAIVRNDEAKTVFMHLQAPDDEFAAETGDDILSAAKLDEVSAFGQTRRALLRAAAALSPLAPSSRARFLKEDRACGARRKGD